MSFHKHVQRPLCTMYALAMAQDSKGREAHFQDFAHVLVLKGVGPLEELLVQKEKKYSLGTFSSGRRLHTIPYHTIINSKKIQYSLDSFLREPYRHSNV